MAAEPCSVYGFKAAEHAAAFKAWTESAGIDWRLASLARGATVHDLDHLVQMRIDVAG